MTDYVYHHYVPKFYLRGWCIDNQITRFQWLNDQLEIRRVGIKRNAGMNHLYSLRHAPNDPQVIEREFMGPLIDDPAARVYQHLCNSTVPLSDSQRNVWTRFLMSLRVRMPDVIERLRFDATTELRRNLATQPEEYEALRSDDDPANLIEYLEKIQPGLIADFGIRMLPDLLNHQPIFKKIYEMYWWTHNFQGASVSLLTSDRPLIVVPGLDDLTCVIALPLNPTLVFFATHQLKVAEKITSIPISRLARAVNQETVRLANQFIFSKDQSQANFINRHFAKPN